MLTRLRTHLTYANVMASIAVFIALGGGAYALSIPKDSIGARQLKTNSVHKEEINDGAVRSPDVKDESLLAEDFRAGQLPAGLPGPQGEPGPSGLAGTARAYAHVSGDRAADCPDLGNASLDEVDCEFSRSKGVSRVHLERGPARNFSWCVTVPGIDPETTPAYVVPEISAEPPPLGGPGMNPGDAVALPNGSCGPNEFAVDVYYRFPEEVRNAQNDDTVIVGSPARYAPTAEGVNVGFNIVVP